MEEKQLDFNAPLLSVRRFTSTAASNTENKKRVENAKKPSFPYYNPELKSGPVRNPGTVPFQWEQIPGRPKDGSRLRPRDPELPPLVPKLPPGRTVDTKQPSSAKSTDGKEPGDMNVVNSPQNDTLSSRPTSSSSNKNAINLERSKQNASKRIDKEEHYNVSDKSDDCDDDAYSDALDTLSRTESFFMNCSASGLSALEGSNSRPSGHNLIDPQARKFMMDRFLPAAKAMASETPQYASKRQPAARESPGSVRRANNVDWDSRPCVYGEDRQLPLLQYKRYVKPVAHDVEEEDSDDDMGDYDDTGSLTAKACGMLPRFCLKNSLCLLNPLPGMKVRGRMPLSSVGHRVIAAHTKTPSPDYSSGPDLETWEAVYRHKLSRALQHNGTCDNGSKPTSESHQLTYSSDSQTADGSSPCRRSTGGGISPYRNEANHSPFHEGISFLGVPRQAKNNKLDGLITYGSGSNDDGRVSSHETSKYGSGSSSPAVEKTLYVDSVGMLEAPNARCSSADAKELMITTEKDSELLIESEKLDRMLTLEEHWRGADQEKIFVERYEVRPTASNTTESNSFSCCKELICGEQRDSDSGLKFNGDVQEIKSLESSEGIVNKTPNFNDREKDQEISNVNYMQSPLPPPLPKSPSESWLCRTLPSVSSKNPLTRSYLGVQFRPKKQLLKVSTVDPKWETIVKSSNSQHKQLRFSEELKIYGSNAPAT